MKCFTFSKVGIILPQIGEFVFAVIIGIALLGLAGCVNAPQDTQPVATLPQSSAPDSTPTELNAAPPADAAALNGAETQPLVSSTAEEANPANAQAALETTYVPFDYTYTHTDLDTGEVPKAYKRTLAFKKALTETQQQVLVDSSRVEFSSIPIEPVVPHRAYQPSPTSNLVQNYQYNPTTIRPQAALDTLWLQQLEWQIQSQAIRMDYTYNPITDFNSPIYNYNWSSDLWTSYSTPNYLSSFYNTTFNPVTIQPVTSIQINPITIQPVTPIRINPIYIQPITPIYINPITTWP